MALMNLIYKKKVKTQIGTVTIDASVTENHTTTSTPTRNPVEEGIEVTDHVSLEPAKLSIQGVISDTPLNFDIIGNIASGDLKSLTKNLTSGFSDTLGGTSRSTEQYQALLALQRSRQPFKVITGIKVYENMILTSLSVDRTATTGKSIHFSADMEEIRIVKSQNAGPQNLGKSVKDLGAKTKNLGGKVTTQITEKDLKSFKGVTNTLGNIGAAFRKVSGF